MIGNKQGRIEPLLLLCCLVGVVSFFALSLSFSSVLMEPLQDAELPRQQEDLLKQREEKEALLRQLEEQQRDLERQMQNKRDGLSNLKLPAIPEEDPEETLRNLNEEHKRLSQRIEQIRRDLANVPPSVDQVTRQAKEGELAELLARLQEIARKISELVDRKALPADDQKTNIVMLQRELDRLRQQRQTLEKILEDLVARSWIGDQRFRNPLFVECRENAYIFYPEGAWVAVKEAEQRNIFRERAAGHDIVVLLVRPDGIDSFRKAYQKVKDMSVNLAYEPVETSRNLSYLRSTQR